jgi:hypothetical protein
VLLCTFGVNKQDKSADGYKHLLVELFDNIVVPDILKLEQAELELFCADIKQSNTTVDSSYNNSISDNSILLTWSL